jgi:hypothetical protein
MLPAKPSSVAINASPGGKAVDRRQMVLDVLRPLAAYGFALAVLLLIGSHAFAASPAAFSTASGKTPPAPWKVIGLPERYAKPLSQFDIAEIDGARVLRVVTDQSWGSLVHPSADAVKPETRLKWRWRLDQPLAKSDLRTKATDDGALKVCLSFDMPFESVPAGERTLIRLVQFFTKEKIPTATLCYLWGGKEPLGHEQASLITNRVRFVVLANEATQLKAWQSVERNIHADFLKAFGQESRVVPALAAIIIGADSDNTAGSSLGYVSDVQISGGNTQ